VTLSWLLAIIGAVLPFIVVLAALGAAGYWGRRWLRARGAGRSRPASGS
jgi:CHASE2 domain-containing sensor protein